MNFELLVATSNKHKLQEIRSILSPHKITVYGLNDLNLKLGEVNEDGKTYFDNALIKAIATDKLVTMPIISDDSGIEILSLDNKPGIMSARFADSFGGYPQTFEYIFKELNGKDRSARFVCDIVLINVEDKPLLFEGIVEGEITTETHGDDGFGYDPIFKEKNTNKTYAEMTSEEKNLHSHRAKALKKLITYLKINGLCK